MHKFRQKYIGDKAFYKRYLMLAIPMIIQNAITNLVSFLDNIMVGQLGTEQMSGVAIVNQLIFVYNLAVFGAVSAASIFGAQYFGKGNHKGHMYSFRFKLYAALLVTAIAMALFITNGTGLISLYLTDTAGNGATEAALAYGKEYLEIVMIGLIPFAVTQAYATNIKETGQTIVPMAASFAAVGSSRSELSQKSFRGTIVFWLFASYLIGCVTYLVITNWWTIFPLLALLVLTFVIIRIYNHRKDQKACSTRS